MLLLLRARALIAVSVRGHDRLNGPEKCVHVKTLKKGNFSHTKENRKGKGKRQAEPIAGERGGPGGGRGQQPPPPPVKSLRTSVLRNPPLVFTKFVYALLPFKVSASQPLPFARKMRSKLATKKY